MRQQFHSEGRISRHTMAMANLSKAPQPQQMLPASLLDFLHAQQTDTLISALLSSLVQRLTPISRDNLPVGVHLTQLLIDAVSTLLFSAPAAWALSGLRYCSSDSQANRSVRIRILFALAARTFLGIYRALSLISPLSGINIVVPREISLYGFMRQQVLKNAPAVAVVLDLLINISSQLFESQRSQNLLGLILGLTLVRLPSTGSILNATRDAMLDRLPVWRRYAYLVGEQIMEAPRWFVPVASYLMLLAEETIEPPVSDAIAIPPPTLRGTEGLGVTARVRSCQEQALPSVQDYRDMRFMQSTSLECTIVCSFLWAGLLSCVSEVSRQRDRSVPVHGSIHVRFRHQSAFH